MLDQLPDKVKARIISQTIMMGGCTENDIQRNKVVAFKTNLSTIDPVAAVQQGEMCSHLVQTNESDEQCIIYYYKLVGFNSKELVVGKVVREGGFTHFYHAKDHKEMIYCRTTAFDKKLGNLHVINLN